MSSQFRARLAVELAAIEVRLLVVAVVAVAAAEAARSSSGMISPTPFSATVDLLALSAALFGMVSAATVFGRDREARLLERVQGARHPALRETQLALSLTLAYVLAGAMVLVGVVARVVAEERGGSNADSLIATTLAMPFWVVIGAAITERVRTRAAAFTSVTITALVVPGLEQLAQGAPAASWLFASTPDALGDVIRGGSSTAIPDLRTPLVPVLGSVGWALAALVYVGRSGPATRPRHPWLAGRWLRVPLVALAVLAAPIVGIVGGPALRAALPWQLSPRWAIDQASGTTPEAALETMFEDLRAGREEAAARATLGNRLDRALGRYRVELVPVPADIAFEAATTADVAGVVRIEWTSRLDDRRSAVTACTTREPSGWKLVTFIDLGTCPAAI
ncbi:MAG TPA: hypothetical protein VF230_03970 [Acidimicrobiales bacterium]